MFNTVTVSENFYSNRIKVFVSKDTFKKIQQWKYQVGRLSKVGKALS